MRVLSSPRLLIDGHCHSIIVGIFSWCIGEFFPTIKSCGRAVEGPQFPKKE